MKTVVLVLALCALPLLLAGCGGSREGGATSPSAGGPAAVNVADAGGIRGVVTYPGPDTDKPISMQGDPACAAAHPEPVDTNEIALKGGKLANVFVYVKSGLEGRSFPAPAEKKRVDQRGCLYSPRVLGVQVGQTVEFTNSDATLHNVHAVPVANTEFNEPQAQGTPPADKRLDKPEVMVPVRCDLHPWMTSYIGVLPHPYYTVSGEDGRFSIRNLPPGRYTLEAWHETLGTQTRDVTVAPRQTVTVGFDFKPKP
ncbi:MAG TPA: carboxypeptidase regulatory-like domain-containing protein [Thermoanaerobaculia bacterium]